MSIFSYIECVTPGCSEKCAPGKLLCDHHWSIDAKAQWFPPLDKFLAVKLGEPYKEYLHRCHFKLERITAWRVTPFPVRLAIRLRVFSCGCGKTHMIEGDVIAMPHEVVR